VALLGDINKFKPLLKLLSIKEGVTTARQVAWISDGGKGFWGVYNELFSKVAQGILDFLSRIYMESIKSMARWSDQGSSKLVY
jgi:hypothetical protein